MTRQEFDSRFAATQQTTEGYTDAQLTAINDRVFAQVADAHSDADPFFKSQVDHLFEREFATA